MSCVFRWLTSRVSIQKARYRNTFTNPRLCQRAVLVVVDDNRDAADSLGTLLKLFGADVKVLYDGQSALEVLCIYRPSLLFLDIGMPRLNAYEVARRERQNPQFGDIVLIALTGWGHEDDRRWTREAGFDQHLVKPVEIAALLAVLVSLERQRT